MTLKTVIIESFDRELPRSLNNCAIVAVDVVRATTTAITAVSLGRRCFVVPTISAALELARRLEDPLLAGEQRGIVPPGFESNNSPAEFALRTDVERPLVLLSSSGTRLCHEAGKFAVSFAACLRNYRTVAKQLEDFDSVALIGAATRGEFREEDQMCCAWIAQHLMEAGFSPANIHTADIVRRWRGASASAWLGGKSAEFLRKSGQLDDLNYILQHIGDLDSIYMLRGDELIAVEAPQASPSADSRITGIATT